MPGDGPDSALRIPRSWRGNRTAFEHKTCPRFPRMGNPARRKLSLVWLTPCPVGPRPREAIQGWMAEVARWILQSFEPPTATRKRCCDYRRSSVRVPSHFEFRPPRGRRIENFLTGEAIACSTAIMIGVAAADNPQMLHSDVFVFALAGLLGLVMGSAVTAIAYRVPRHISWFSGRSACPACGKALGPLDLIPVASFVLSRGRCRHCEAPISWRYPLTELWCGTWSVLIFARTGPVAEYPLLAIWGFLLVALFWIDLDFKLLPDSLTLPGTLIGLAAALLQPQGAHRAIFGILAGSGTLSLVAWLYLKVRRIEGMGGGDIKLAAMFGVVLGGPLTLFTIFLAAASGSVWGGLLALRGRANARTELPFGTLLSPAAMVALLWGDGILRAYLRLMHRG